MLADTTTIETIKGRTFLPAKFNSDSWDEISRYFDNLLQRELKSVDDLHQWLLDRSEIEAALQEDLGWRYIRMSCDTANEEFSKSFNFFVGEIQPKISTVSNDLDKKLLASPLLSQINDNAFEIYLRQVRKRNEIFRDANVPLQAELQQKEHEYAVITGAMTVEVDGKEITLQQAGNYLRDNDRAKREEVFRKIMTRRLADKEKLDTLFDELVKLRHQVALNADFKNYRDYMFAALGRFDYTPQDCFDFHESVHKYVVPISEELDRNHIKNLGYTELRPWDSEVETGGDHPLLPFKNAEELVSKTITCFNKLDAFLANCVKALDDKKRFDLESRIGKAPGGYNYPLYESGLPFIFMNSTNTLRDLVTMVHEGGHAVHSILTKDLALVDYKNLPSEVAELASMSMELLSMEYWDEFFKDPADLKRARKQHLEKVLEALPWIAAIDKFQHWIYTNPTHTATERRTEWMSIYKSFNGNVVNWTGLEDIAANIWQRQLHIFEVPFYYIEYGFAQLGAIAVWRNYKSNPTKALQQYIAALSLGYTATIGDIYKTAGISFEFSGAYIRELCDFVKKELNDLEK